MRSHPHPPAKKMANITLCVAFVVEICVPRYAVITDEVFDRAVLVYERRASFATSQRIRGPPAWLDRPRFPQLQLTKAITTQFENKNQHTTCIPLVHHL